MYIYIRKNTDVGGKKMTGDDFKNYPILKIQSSHLDYGY